MRALPEHAQPIILADGDQIQAPGRGNRCLHLHPQPTGNAHQADTRQPVTKQRHGILRRPRPGNVLLLSRSGRAGSGFQEDDCKHVINRNITEVLKNVSNNFILREYSSERIYSYDKSSIEF